MYACGVREMRLILTLCQIKGSPGFCGGLQTSRVYSDEGSVKTRRGHPPAKEQVTIIASGIAGINKKIKVVAILLATTFYLIKLFCSGSLCLILFSCKSSFFFHLSNFCFSSFHSFNIFGKVFVFNGNILPFNKNIYNDNCNKT